MSGGSAGVRVVDGALHRAGLGGAGTRVAPALRSGRCLHQLRLRAVARRGKRPDLVRHGASRAIPTSSGSSGSLSGCSSVWRRWRGRTWEDWQRSPERCGHDPLRPQPVRRGHPDPDGGRDPRRERQLPVVRDRGAGDHGADRDRDGGRGHCGPGAPAGPEAGGSGGARPARRLRRDASDGHRCRAVADRRLWAVAGRSPPSRGCDVVRGDHRERAGVLARLEVGLLRERGSQLVPREGGIERIRGDGRPAVRLALLQAYWL